MHFTILETAGILRISPDDVWLEVKQGGLEMEPEGISRRSLIKRVFRRRP